MNQAKARREIVIIDDETDILDMLNEDFKAAGYTVWCAENISSGLALVKNRLPPIVLSDVKLPLGGGKDLFDEILEFPAEVRPKVVFITGKMVLSVEDAFDQGAEGFIAKPFSTNKVIDYISWVNQKARDRWSKDVPTPKALQEMTQIQLNFADRLTAEKNGDIRIGRGGVFITMEHPKVAQGETVSLSIEFKNSKIVGTGVVRWVRAAKAGAWPPGIGVEFNYLEPASLQYLLGEERILGLHAFIPKG